MSDRFEVEVRLFGRHREMAGDSVRVEMTTGGTVADLRSALAEHPSLGPSIDGAAVAVNRKYESDACAVVVGDEVAVIPPVAGG